MHIETYRASGAPKFENDHGGLYELTDDDHTQYAVITSGSGNPGGAPARVGAVYVDTSNKIAYLGKAASAAADFVETAAMAMTTAQRDAISSPATGLRIWNTDESSYDVYDGQRWRKISYTGWLPNAFQVNYQANLAFTTVFTLAVNQGIAIPIRLHSHMYLRSVSVRNTDTSGARAWSWRLWRQLLDSDSEIAYAGAASLADSFTASAASTRTLDGVHQPFYIQPGLYWVIIFNEHASNNFGLGSTAASSAFAPNSAQHKTDVSLGQGSTKDFVTGWTKVTGVYAVSLDGLVFGQTGIF